MKKTALVLATALLCGALLLLPHSAEATFIWNTNVGGCVPIDDEIQSDTYNIINGGGLFKHQGSGTGTIETICHITDMKFYGSAVKLNLYYEDFDASATNGITYSLKKWYKATGSESTLCSATTPSTTNDDWAVASTGSCGIISAATSKDNFYWARIQVFRSNTTGVAAKALTIVPN